MRVNGNLRGLAWAAAGGAVYNPAQAGAVPGARGGGSAGSAYDVPSAPIPAPMAPASPQIRPVALGPAARPSPPTMLPGAALGPASSAPAAIVTAPVTDGTATALIPSSPPSGPSAIPWALLATIFLGSQ